MPDSGCGSLNAGPPQLVCTTETLLKGVMQRCDLLGVNEWQEGQ